MVGLGLADEVEHGHTWHCCLEAALDEDGRTSLLAVDEFLSLIDLLFESKEQHGLIIATIYYKIWSKLLLKRLLNCYCFLIWS